MGLRRELGLPPSQLRAYPTPPGVRDPNSVQQRALSEQVCLSPLGPRRVLCLTKENILTAQKLVNSREKLAEPGKRPGAKSVSLCTPQWEVNRATGKESWQPLCFHRSRGLADQSVPASQKVFSKGSFHVCLSLVHTPEMKAPVLQRKCYLLDKQRAGWRHVIPKFSLISSIIQNPVSFCMRGGAKGGQWPEAPLTSEEKPRS